MVALQAEGMQPHHRLLDIGCGALRLGCRAVPYLDPGHYWGTDASADLMAAGYAQELTAQDRLPAAQLIADGVFAFAGVPDTIDYAIAFAVFTHLPPGTLRPALTRLRARCPHLKRLLLTVFLGETEGAHKQPDGVVTHATRPPYHRPAADVLADCAAAGFTGAVRATTLPRGQRLCVAVIAGR